MPRTGVLACDADAFQEVSRRFRGKICDLDATQEYRLLSQAFEKALEVLGRELVVYYYRIAGGTVRVRFVGRHMAQLLDRPLNHLRVERQEPDLRIDAWDEECTSVAAPVPTGVALHLNEEFVVRRLGQSRAILARPSQHLVSCIRGTKYLSLYELGRPWHAPLAIWHLDRGVPLIHSGALRGRGGGILVGGPSGSGKSTTCLRATMAGARFLGDDMVGLAHDGKDYVAHSLYGSTFLSPSDRSRYPGLQEGMCAPRQEGEDKWLAFVPSGRQPSCRLKAVVLPRVVPGKGRSTLSPARPSEVLLRLGPSSIQVGRLSPGRLGFELLAGLCERLPGYHLELGSQVPEALEELLA